MKREEIDQFFLEAAPLLKEARYKELARHSGVKSTDVSHLSNAKLQGLVNDVSAQKILVGTRNLCHRLGLLGKEIDEMMETQSEEAMEV